MENLEKIRKSLAEAATELNPSSCCPININGVLKHLNISLQFSRAGNRSGKAYLIICDSPKVVISEDAKRRGLAPGERFSVAHEVGHWVVWRRFGIVPSCKPEYWKHEAICNEFAARLLIPPIFLEGFLSELINRHRVLPIFLPRALAASAQVSWEVAARSITSLSSSGIAYLRLGRSGSAGCEHGNEEDTALEVTSSSLSDRPGSFVAHGALIRDSSILDWLSNVRVNDVAERRCTLDLGRLRFDDVSLSCTRQPKNVWVVQFLVTDSGLRIRR
jgi:Zn-dependent peptidase ImmA (M78 family)